MDILTVRLPDDLMAALEKTGKPKAEVVRAALRQYLLPESVPQAVSMDMVEEAIRKAIAEHELRCGGQQPDSGP